MYRDHAGRQRKVFGRTIAEAKRKRAERQVNATAWSVDSRQLVRDYAPAWIEGYQGRTERGIRDSTREDYRSAVVNDIVPYFGRLRLDEVGPPSVRDFAAELAKRGLEPGSVRKILAVLKAMLATAVEDGAIRANPAASIRVARPERTGGNEDRVKALSEEDLAAFLEVVPSWWQLFFRFLAESGLRIGEAIELRWHDVDVGSRTVKVRRSFSRARVSAPKSRYGKRTIRLTPRMAQALWPAWAARNSDDALVFPAPRGGRIDAHNLLRRVVKPTAVAIGLGEWLKTPKGGYARSWVGLHTFRHTCLTMLFCAGWNAKQVQVWAGHHSPSFTLDTYVHLLPEDLPEPPFGHEAGNSWATVSPETGRTDDTLVPEEIAV